MFVRFTGFYRVFRFVQGFPEFNWVLLRVSIVFTEFYWVLPGFTEFFIIISRARNLVIVDGVRVSTFHFRTGAAAYQFPLVR